MPHLPIFQPTNTESVPSPLFLMMETSWAQILDSAGSQLDKLAAQPLSRGQLLPQVVLVIGSNTIPHNLNRVLTGWFFTRQGQPAAFKFTGTTTLAGATITAVSNMTNIYVGAILTSTTLPVGSKVLSFDIVANTITLTTGVGVTAGTATDMTTPPRGTYVYDTEGFPPTNNPGSSVNLYLTSNVAMTCDIFVF